MDSDQLKKGNNLSELISTLKVQLFIWANAKRIDNIMICSKHPERVESYCSCNANADHIDFEVLKTLTISTIQKKLAEAEKEFASI